MTAATKSRMECSASDKTPKLPVRTTRNIFSEISRTAEPTEASAAMRFSWDARSSASKAIGGLYAAHGSAELSDPRSGIESNARRVISYAGAVAFRIMWSGATWAGLA